MPFLIKLFLIQENENEQTPYLHASATSFGKSTLTNLTINLIFVLHTYS